MEKHRRITIGKIVGVHGIKGVVKVYSYAESPLLFRTGGPFWFEDSQGNGTVRAIAWARPHKRGLLAGIEGIGDRNAAEALVGQTIAVDRKQLPEPGADCYYWVDLIGMAVYTGEGDYLGRLCQVIPTPAHDVYQVRQGDGERLIPAVGSVVRQVDIAAGRMTVVLPEGL